VVLKFYRAGRWSAQQIREEHDFAAQLVAAEVPVIAPMQINGDTLHVHGGLMLAAYPLQAGGAPDTDAPGAREVLGRTVARLHAVGARSAFEHRGSLDAAAWAEPARRSVLDSPLLPEAAVERYARVSDELLQRVQQQFDDVGFVPRIRTHGDCHPGNILWHAGAPLLVDLDDALNAPRIQDLWMLLSGNADEQRRQWADLMEGYRQFGSLEARETRLIEALRSLRMIRHAGWVCVRWQDPAFPRAFPWMAEARWWDGHIADLQGQVEALEDVESQVGLW